MAAAWISFTGNRSGAGNPPPNDIIPGLRVNFSSSLISDARISLAFLEYRCENLLTMLSPLCTHLASFFKPLALLHLNQFSLIIMSQGKFLITSQSNIVPMGRMNFLGSIASFETKEGQLTLVALIMMLYVMAIFVGVAIHEVLGHGLATIAFGGDFYALYLSPGSGYISFHLPDSVSAHEAAFIYMAGITVQIAVGLAIMLLVFPKIKNLLAGLFTLMLSVALLVHPSLYLFLGYFYQNGDTKYAAALLGIQPDLFVVAGLIMTGIFTLMISAAALNFIGSFLNVGDEKTRNKILLIFWMKYLRKTPSQYLVCYLPKQPARYWMNLAASFDKSWLRK